MNIDYLMDYICYRLHTIVFKYPYDTKETTIVCKRIDLEQEISHNNSDLYTLADKLMRFAVSQKPFTLPTVYVDSYAAAFSFIDTEKALFCIGPIRLTNNAKYFHTLPDQYITSECYQILYKCEISNLITEALLLHNVYNNAVITLDDAISYNCIASSEKLKIQTEFLEIIFKNQEYSLRHNPYDQEVREVTSIRNGDLEQLKKSWEEDYLGTIGTLGPTPLRHAQNLGIILVTLGSRAALEGGLLPELAFSLSDSYIHRIEEATNPEAAWQLGRQAEYQYASMIHNLRQSKRQKQQGPDSRIDSCKEYIFNHLHDKITTSDIAKALYMNADYLSVLFKKHEGMTPSEYILQKKIELAKNMLTYSRYSYSSIASYLGFCSQSHLGRYFKRVTGMTLHQYREKYGVKNY